MLPTLANCALAACRLSKFILAFNFLWTNAIQMDESRIATQPRGDLMLSDRIISYFSRFIAITRHDLFVFGFAILVCLMLWSVLYFSRKRVVVLRRSSGTDQITFELSRIADALERIASQPADRVIAAVRRQQRSLASTASAPPATPVARDTRMNPYSIFRR
jgi:hypothetical protein